MVGMMDYLLFCILLFDLMRSGNSFLRSVRCLTSMRHENGIMNMSPEADVAKGRTSCPGWSPPTQVVQISVGHYGRGYIEVVWVWLFDLAGGNQTPRMENFH
jgi:hypothetical protein